MTRCALVTGGSKNIGGGIAAALAEHGYDVAITYATDREGAENTKKLIEAAGRRCFVYEAHLENAEEPARVVRRANTDLGRLDAMVCNAGRDMRNSVLTATADDYDFLFKNTVRNYYLCAGAAARIMVRDKTAGSIILVTSVRAKTAHPDDFLYGGFKAAMERACQSMALDLSEFNIRVNCLAPGAVWKNNPVNPFTRESIPLQRVGTPRDMGEAAVFLAGESSNYITGTTLLVDGGLSLPGLLESPSAVPWKTERWAKMRYEKAMALLDDEIRGDEDNGH